MSCNKQDNMLTIQCDACKMFVRACCAQIDGDDATRITRQRAKGVRYFCNTCNRSLDQFSELKLLLKSIEECLTKLEAHPKELDPEVFESVVRETRERVQRESNLIIYGVVESNLESDHETINKIVKSIKTDVRDIPSDRVMRLGKQNGDKPRIIRVVFDNPFIVKAILKGKNKLKSFDRFKDVYLKSDETFYQRERLKQCRELLKSRLANGENNLSIKYTNGIPSIISCEQKKKN